MSASEHDDAAGLSRLIGSAFAQGEPALPDVDTMLEEVEALGRGIRRRQRVRAGIGAVALCLTAFGMVVGITHLAHSGSSTTVMVPGGGGGAPGSDPGNLPAPVTGF